jgi:hypothetical protein
MVVPTATDVAAVMAWDVVDVAARKAAKLPALNRPKLRAGAPNPITKAARLSIE